MELIHQFIIIGSSIFMIIFTIILLTGIINIDNLLKPFIIVSYIFLIDVTYILIVECNIINLFK
jgi:hypothetical protein